MSPIVSASAGLSMKSQRPTNTQLSPVELRQLISHSTASFGSRSVDGPRSPYWMKPADFDIHSTRWPRHAPDSATWNRLK